MFISWRKQKGTPEERNFEWNTIDFENNNQDWKTKDLGELNGPRN